MTNILNLGLKHNFSPNVENNIKLIYDKFGEHFTIRHQKVDFPAKLVYSKFDSHVEYFQLIYYTTLKSTWFHVFQISFLADRVYVNSIKKSDDYSGTQIMNMLITLCKILKVKMIELVDRAITQCGNWQINLSLMRLIERNETYYMKFGFKPDVSQVNNRLYNYKTSDEVLSDIQKYIKQFKKLTRLSYISHIRKIIDFLTENEIVSQILYDVNTLQECNSAHTLISEKYKIISQYSLIVTMLEKSTKKYVYEMMTSNCDIYLYIISDMYENDQVAVFVTTGKSLTRTYSLPLLHAMRIHNLFNYVLFI